MVGFRVGGKLIMADGARAALDTCVARRAPVGAALLGPTGVLIARRMRVAVDGVWLAAWLPARVWRGPEAPIRLRHPQPLRRAAA